MVSKKKEEAMKFILELQSEETVQVEAAILFGIVLLMDGKMQEAHQRLRPVINDSNITDFKQRLNTLQRHKLLKRGTLTLFLDALALQI